MYQLLNDLPHIKRLSDDAIIPPDPGNCDFVAYQEWLEAGNEPQPADAAPVIPHDQLAANVTVGEWNQLVTALNIPGLLK